jgi:Protein of unknown function (DUF2785)
MSRRSWKTVIEAGFAVPPDRPLGDQTADLVELLGDPDPELRDELAYSILSTWIARGVYDDLLVSLGDSVARGMFVGLGSDGQPTIFRRSFAALVVAACINRDEAARLTSRDVFLRWSDLGLSWFLAERDLRGRIPGQGWAHAGAHGADLLQAIAASHHTGQDEARVVLDVISERLRTPTQYVLVDNEVDRLALAALTVVYRNLVAGDPLDAWVSSLSAGLEPPDPGSPGLSGSGRGADWPSASAHNISGFIRAMYVHLAAGISPQLSRPGNEYLFKQAPPMRADLLLALLAAVPKTTPWLYSG